RCHHPLAPQASASAYSATRTWCADLVGWLRLANLARLGEPLEPLAYPLAGHIGQRPGSSGMPWLRPTATQVGGDAAAALPGHRQAVTEPPLQAKPQAQPASKLPPPSVTTVTKRDHLI